MNSASYSVRRVSADDLALMNSLLEMFGDVFNEPDTYCSKRPSASYQRQLLGSDSFIALTAVQGKDVIGGLAAYELKKFEPERSEIYIYDLAVKAAHRRQGVATALISELQSIAKASGAYVIFVQADMAEEDQPAIALYTKLGNREEVLHFDIPVDDGCGCNSNSV
jgi:aminoglycoside 3-N-acetyltransferase I